MLRFEVLQAQEGDCFVMRWSQGPITRIAVIDGGPRASDGHSYPYRNLEKRLHALKLEAAPPVPTLPLDWVMVSHIDDDHINGLLTLMTSLRDMSDRGETPPFQVRRFWLNAFEDLADVRPAASTATVAALASLGSPQANGISHETQAILASVGQGRTLRDALGTLGLDDNAPVGGFVKSGIPLVDIDGLKVTVVAPLEAQLENLRKDWIKSKPRTIREAAYADQSVANLSSIVCHVAFKTGDKTRTLLLTGDARGDYILVGLHEAGLLQDGKIRLDLLKVPHHASDRNTTEDFFKAVIADHYVISANGKHNNPDKDTLDWLIDARGADSYTIHLSNQLPWMAAFFAARQNGRNFTIVYRGMPDENDNIDEINLD